MHVTEAGQLVFLFWTGGMLPDRPSPLGLACACVLQLHQYAKGCTSFECTAALGPQRTTACTCPTWMTPPHAASSFLQYVMMQHCICALGTTQAATTHRGLYLCRLDASEVLRGSKAPLFRAIVVQNSIDFPVGKDDSLHVQGQVRACAGAGACMHGGLHGVECMHVCCCSCTILLMGMSLE